MQVPWGIGEMGGKEMEQITPMRLEDKKRAGAKGRLPMFPDK